MQEFFVHFETLGCRLNQIESEGAAKFFFEEGFSVLTRPVQSADAPDGRVCLCVLNTCAVTTKAEQKARRTIRLLLEKFPGAVLIVTGCYAELSESQILALDESGGGKRIAVLPGKAKSILKEIPLFYKNVLTENPFEKDGAKKISDFILKSKEVAKDAFLLSSETFFSHSRASLKVQDGCNNSCSYCAIHLARGKSLSIDPALALTRVQALEACGQNEVVLTGVNIGQYSGTFEGKKIGVPGLLKIILEGTKKIAVRFSSIYPETVTQEFLDVIKNPRVRPHFHLSVQSGSDSILKKMARPYGRDSVIQACGRLKEAKENPFLACDIITGFPGETEEDFFATMDLIKKAGFINVHAFPFSPRPGTAAFTMTPKIPERIKVARVQALNEYSAAKKEAYINSFSGRTLDAIAETSHSNNGEMTHAVTENFIHAEIIFKEGEKKPKSGQAVRVKILGAKKDQILCGGEWNAEAVLC